MDKQTHTTSAGGPRSTSTATNHVSLGSLNLRDKNGTTPLWPSSPSPIGGGDVQVRTRCGDIDL